MTVGILNGIGCSKKILKKTLNGIVKKIESIVKLILNKDFSLNKKQKEELEDVIRDMANNKWPPYEKTDYIYSDLNIKNKGYLIKKHKENNITYKIRLRYHGQSHFHNNCFSNNREHKYSVNIRIHHADMEERFNNISHQIGTSFKAKVSPQEADYYFIIKI